MKTLLKVLVGCAVLACSSGAKAWDHGWHGGHWGHGGWGWGHPHWHYGVGVGWPYYGYYGYPYGYPYGYNYGPAYYRGYYGGGRSVAVDVQAALSHHGYHVGMVDGVLGPQSRAAIRNYQADHGLPVTGSIDRPLLHSLRLG